MTNISKKMTIHVKNTQMNFSQFSIQLGMSEKIGMWLVCDCSGIQMVYECHKKTKIEKIGIQSVVCGNLICD